MNKTIKERLEHLRKQLKNERISYGELAELQELAPHIEDGDLELMEAAGVPEFLKGIIPKYPWDVLVKDLHEDWYSIPFSIRLAMWHNVKKDFGWMPSGNPDNTNTWGLACQGAIYNGITPIRDDVVDVIIKHYDLDRAIHNADFYGNPYAKRAFQENIVDNSHYVGTSVYWWIDKLLRWERNSLMFVPILYHLEWLSDGKIWDMYIEQAANYGKWLMDQKDSWIPANVEANTEHANTAVDRAKAQVAEWLNQDYIRLECERWIDYYKREKNEILKPNAKRQLDLFQRVQAAMVR